MNEAVRISGLLKPFRWKVEPAYSIGVILDDILSIESANQEMSGAVTKQIESAGYTLSGVTVDRGKPVAWFKKEPAFATSPLLDAAEVFRSRTRVSELERSIEDRRMNVQKEKEGLEAWLSLLRRLLRDARSPAPNEPSPRDSPSASPEIVG